MARKFNAEPLKNITNRQQSKKSAGLSDVEQNVLIAHIEQERNEICYSAKYAKQIMSHYESLDKTHIFVEVDITYEMRSLLVDWLISCHEKLGLSDDALYLSIFIIDRFLSGRSIASCKLQLVGITALVIASKYEEVHCPDLKSFLLLSDNTINEADIKKAEKYMLYSLNYNIEYVNPLTFLRRVSRANNYEAKSRKMAKYFLELMVLNKKFSSFKMAVLGTTAMYLARKICSADHNKNLFFYYARLDRNDLKDCFEALTKIIFSDAQYENLETKYDKDSMYHVNVLARNYARRNFN